jgi:pyruvate formate lyase activating enzyme
VIFTTGCPLRCLYCHNPDCREPQGGRVATVDELIEDIQRYKSFLRHGGVTVTGGEPLMQPAFVREIFKRCRELGIHTALDTSGFTSLESAKPVLDFTDLVLLDIKSFDPTTFHHVTKVAIEPTLRFARYLSDIGKPAWIRFVLVPGLTDAPSNVNGLAEFVGSLSNVEKVEVLPFHKMGEYKWQELGYDYQLSATEPPSPELIQSTVQAFQQRGLTVVSG